MFEVKVTLIEVMVMIRVVAMVIYSHWWSFRKAPFNYLIELFALRLELYWQIY